MAKRKRYVPPPAGLWAQPVPKRPTVRAPLDVEALKEEAGIVVPVPARLIDTADWSWYKVGKHGSVPERINWDLLDGAINKMLLSYPMFRAAKMKGTLNFVGYSRSVKLVDMLNLGLFNCDLPKSRPVRLVAVHNKEKWVVQELRKGRGTPILFFIHKSGYPTVVWP